MKANLGYTKESIIDVENENRKLKNELAQSQSAEKSIKDQVMKLRKLKQSLNDENDECLNNLHRSEKDFSSNYSSKQAAIERLDKKAEHLKSSNKRKESDIQQVNKLVSKNASVKELVADKEKQIKNIKENHKIELDQLKADKKLINQKIEN
jgi:chromosome segregation ATPase